MSAEAGERGRGGDDREPEGRDGRPQQEQQDEEQQRERQRDAALGVVDGAGLHGPVDATAAR